MSGDTTEMTLALIKPDAVESRVVGRIISMIEREGLRIRGLRMELLSTERAEAFYAVHVGQPFYEPLVAFMTSGPVIALVLEAPNAVKRWRALMGPTDAPTAPDGTIRRAFGTTQRRNATHGSDSVQSAQTEISFFFRPDEIS